MIPIEIEVISYDIHMNNCKARLQNGNIINLDPFVGCAIELTDEGYENGEGDRIVGKTYVLTKYTVYAESVVPHENGMMEV